MPFERLTMVDARTEHLTTPACDWLESIAAPSGAVPILLPSIVGLPRAHHFETTNYEAGLNPIAPLAAHAHRLGIAYPWVERATDHCFTEVEADRVPGEADAVLGLAELAQAAPDRAGCSGRRAPRWGR